MTLRVRGVASQIVYAFQVVLRTTVLFVLVEIPVFCTPSKAR